MLFESFSFEFSDDTERDLALVCHWEVFALSMLSSGLIGKSCGRKFVAANLSQTSVCV